jgi:hypothetical protein
MIAVLSRTGSPPTASRVQANAIRRKSAFHKEDSQHNI